MKRSLAWMALIGAGLAAYSMPAYAHRIVYEDQVIEVPAPPPPERVEVIPAPPSETVVWRPGNWKWEDHDWVWVPGHYVERPHPEAVWVPGHWIYHHWGSTWEPGHWA